MVSQRRGRKRKSEMNGEAVKVIAPPPKRSYGTVHLMQSNWMPSVVEEFFDNDNFEKIVKEMKAIDENVAFVGPFRKLIEKSDENGADLIMLDREVTDLPEMQTFIKSTIGRYAFWRDYPGDDLPDIVFVDLKKIPELSVVGNTVEHAVHHFCGQFLKYQDNSKKAKNAISNILEILGDNRMKDESLRAIKERKKLTVGGIVGPGMYLENHPNGKPRYRRLSNNTNDQTIENLLRCLNNLYSRDQQQKVIKLIEPLLNDLMVYNEEGDYGNGLELGHVMFLANQKAIEDDMKIALVNAYRLLNRHDYEKILELTLELR